MPLNMRATKPPVTAVQKAYTEIRRRIIDGALAEGTPIRQDEVAQAMGVSKIPVREALMRLQSEGLVTITPNAGAAVAVLTVADYVEMLDMRIALECRALELAVPNMAPSDLETAHKLLAAYDHAMTQQEWSDLNLRFHDCLYAPANRPRLMAMTRAVQDQMGRVLRLRVSMAAGHNRSHQEHILLLEACERGDAALAVSLLRKHIEQTQREVQAYFRNQHSEQFV
jgi:DNA-binding GntR family transcriptional regulator